MKRFATTLIALAAMVMGTKTYSDEFTSPIATADLVFEEVDGVVAVEAEHFYEQKVTDKRAWYITSSKKAPDLKPDADDSHAAGASGGAYVETLPDTRKNHGEKLISGENFTDKAGLLAILSYKVHIKNPGRYYVWVRSYSTGSEDNGVHVGLDGQWPESGKRWQTVKKNNWEWECKQRTPQVHTGVPMQLFLDIDTAGEHEILFSMREDGFEMDKFVLASDKNFKPEGQGPQLKVKSGKLPDAFPEVAQETAAKKESFVLGAPLTLPRQSDGNGEVSISGELKQWHKVTLTLDGPFANERDAQPNAFTDLAFNVTFTHQSGSPSYTVPGYFAADGDAGNSGADSGTKWRAHLSPDKTGTWKYAVSFMQGKNAALDGSGEALKAFDGANGSFDVSESDKSGRDFRSEGRLQYVGKHHLQFAGSKRYFLKAGPDSPETLLAYVDFDNHPTDQRKKVPLKTFKPHLADWKSGDPSWGAGKGKGLIGSLNYLADKGVNAFSFLTYNASGDGDNVWPFIQRDAKMHYDCSKLDQWAVVLDHATNLGLHLHFKLQENEMDDNRLGPERKERSVPESLDGGKLGPERKLYCREMIARFSHELALNWNIGEENTQSSEEIRDMVQYLNDTDPYKHNIVIHTFPPQQEKVYNPLLGNKSQLTGVSLQNSWNRVHQQTLHWLRASKSADRPWVVANDEQNPAGLGVPADPGYKGHDGVAQEENTKGSKAEGNFKSKPYNLHDIRKLTLWGNLMAGGAGVEYYFGYSLPENDLKLEDFRSRDKSWDYCRIALQFFSENKIPIAEMVSSNSLIGNDDDDNSKYCLAKSGELYLVYLPGGGTTELNLADANGSFRVDWYNPREGGPLVGGSVTKVNGGSKVSLGAPPADADQDWLVMIRR
ncbi:DUF5060 domain-containing protein [Novipirellula artificiosorum]|uniref:DUF5060 domain-containing protein n=1 Tax=Novipirellula artificiosorum TaxID=2528016 RepID=A0A5C6D4L9_9BACT|nr:DUF5060 domain-containing protein [Novipirellula artificiosorum]TWU30691.1 hypothetical protein Poly41_65960 [Novipirellula artificiosorum]